MGVPIVHRGLRERSADTKKEISSTTKGKYDKKPRADGQHRLQTVVLYASFGRRMFVKTSIWMFVKTSILDVKLMLWVTFGCRTDGYEHIFWMWMFGNVSV